MGSRKKSNFLNGSAIKALHPPPSPELNDSRNFFLYFSLKMPETGFGNFFSPPNFWTKRAVFFGNYCKKGKILTDKL